MSKIKKTLKEIVIIVGIMSCWMVILFGVPGYIFSYLGEGEEDKVCMERGLVWDYDRKVCDPDCLMWVEGKGCVSLKVLEQIERDVCGGYPYKCTIAQKLEVTKKTCEVYGGAVNIELRHCNKSFELKDCGKLKGYNLYPKECGLPPEMTY